MNAAAIAALSRAGVAVEVVAQTGSTNADLRARASTLAAPLLLIAEHQSAGRGRAGRSWLSSPEGSLTFSLAWRFDGGPQALLGLPLAVGVALADTLGTLGQQVQLKWPNDVLKDGDKLAGILMETQSAPGGGTWTVIGIGLNLLMPDEMEAQLGRSAAGMPWLARMDRDALMAALLDGLADCLHEFTARGFAATHGAGSSAMRGRARPSSCSTAASCGTRVVQPVSTIAGACCSIRTKAASP
jgi:BirA family biotin operon repressor/biotin-[acetyl-CoA-carboxylase] ligase